MSERACGDLQNTTPLHLAATANALEVVELLLLQDPERQAKTQTVR